MQIFADKQTFAQMNKSDRLYTAYMQTVCMHGSSKLVQIAMLASHVKDMFVSFFYVFFVEIEHPPVI